jgi:sirohydrochlorin cobaltochelatase
MNAKFRKAVVLSMCLASLTCFAGVGHAAYTLNPEVKDATPALRQAAEIGVRTYVNHNRMGEINKDAILVMSFGTTYKDSREKTIDATFKAIQAAHPNTKAVLAFTSHIIVDRIKAKEGLTIPTPEQALAQLKAEGYNRIAITSLDLFPGMEYAYDTAVYDLYKKDFKKMTVGVPIMYWMGQEDQRDDIEEFVKEVSTQFKKPGKGEAVLLMAHGTPHPSNAYYSVLQTRIDRANLGNTYVYTVEGWPRIGDIIPKLKAKGIKSVTLMPIMMVAGDHANNDMAGAEKDSHKSQLEAAGIKVKTYIHGLGENPAVRNMFVDRANEAFTALTTINGHHQPASHMKP